MSSSSASPNSFTLQGDAKTRALSSLDGLSMGDAFGERFFGELSNVLPKIGKREVPLFQPWPYTDDTEMGILVTRHLLKNGEVRQDELAQEFASNMTPGRGYGAGAYNVLSGILAGRGWRRMSREGFGGTGSYGNGAAMRVAPLGAYFADKSLDDVAQQARLCSEITHAHPEGIAGGVAVAVAAALSTRASSTDAPLGDEFLITVRNQTPEGLTRDGIDLALELSAEQDPLEASKRLGNGAQVSSQDTVPFCLWIAARYSTDFVEAMWNTVTALGDRDTTCAIVGGIISSRIGTTGIPDEWFDCREAPRV